MGLLDELPAGGLFEALVAAEGRVVAAVVEVVALPAGGEAEQGAFLL